MGLLDAFKQYWQDASPGGALNPEIPKDTPVLGLLADPVGYTKQNLAKSNANADKRLKLLEAATEETRKTGKWTGPASSAYQNEIGDLVLNTFGPLAITPATKPLLQAMTKEDFLGSPKIVGKSDAADLKPIQLKSLEDVQPVPFMGGKYQAKFSPDGAVVLDGNTPIASYNFGDTLAVAKPYRKQGIGSELVYQQRTYHPEPAQAATRNKVSQGIQESVWDRIQNELFDLERNGQKINDAPGLLHNPAPDMSYQIQHKPMTVEGGAAPLHDLTQSFGDDVYGKSALQYYGSGDPREAQILKTMAKVRGNPNAPVTIYRGVPKDAGSINPGDWVTLHPDVAQDYANLLGDGKVISQQVPASHITSWPDSLLEFGYHPPKP